MNLTITLRRMSRQVSIQNILASLNACFRDSASGTPMELTGSASKIERFSTPVPCFKQYNLSLLPGESAVPNVMINSKHQWF